MYLLDYGLISNLGGKENCTNNRTTRLNHQIRAQQLRVIDEEGHQLGVMTLGDALRAAEESELDLVEISPEADPPVAKIVDWGKYNYQRTKQLQKNRKTAKTLDVKQIRFGLKISDHDLGVKLKKVTEFLEEGHKVKITIFYRGREMAHRDIGFNLAERVITQYADTAVVDQPPQLAGKQLSFVFRSNPRSKTHAQAQNA
ncbi:MAG TPA: translation initiation factor IF-3 [Candidatus Saccharimonadales bacterium]|nr:translation initiation factor IF-3 [Candidatus Saccharimonadales bacterium]